MKRPMVYVALAYIAGLLAWRYLPPAGVIIAAGAALVAVGIVCFLTKSLMWAMLPLFFMLGAFLTDKPDIYGGFDGMPATVYGTVSDIHMTDYGSQILTVDVAEVKVNREVHKYSRKISAITKTPVKIVCGQSVTAVGTATKLDFTRNPGGFSEEGYMRARGFGGKLQNAEVQAGGMKKPFVYYMRKSSEAVSEAFHRALPEEMAGIMDAVVLGETGAIPGDIRDNFRKAGASHILSISGMHLSILAVFILGSFKRAGLRLRAGALATIAVLWAYCFFTGASASTVRAVVMLSILLAGYIIYRTPDVFSSAALAAFVILLKSPLFLWDAGFQLSFSAVLGIAFLTPVFRRWLLWLDFKGVKASFYVAASAAATVATMPLSAYFFHYVSVVGLVANVFILPLMALLVQAGFLFALLNSLFLSGILSSIIYTILFYFIKVTEFFAWLPLSFVVTGQPSLYNIVIYYAAIVIAAYYIKAGAGSKNAKKLAAAAVCVVAAFVGLNARRLFPLERLEIVFLDVGQGDATVLHLPENVDIMIDAGGNLLAEIGDNTGERVVRPYLWYKGKTKLNAVFMTHPDADHCAGVIELMEYYKVGRLFVPDVNFDDEMWEFVLETAERNDIPVTRIKSGYKAVIGKTRIECVHPLYSGKPRDINNGSLTLKITYGESSFLFTGDIESVDEAKILAAGHDVSADVLKVPHHGAKTSSSQAFVKAVSPEAALAGTSRTNPFGHPAPEVVKTYEENNVTLYNTAVTGAVFLVSDGKGVTIDTMREREAKHWSN